MKIKRKIPELVSVLLSLLLFFGSFTVFSACSVTDASHIMPCHWAQVTVTGLGALLTVLFLAALLIPDRKIGGGICISAALVAVLTALVPGTLIRLCTMPQMHCRLVMQPFLVLLASLIAAGSLIAAIIHLKRKDKSS